MAMAKTGPAPMLNMADYIPRNDQERFQLISALVDSDVGPSQAWTLLEVLERIGRTGDDGMGPSKTAHVRRSQYRRMLSRLGGPPWLGGRHSEYKGALITSVDQFRRGRPSKKSDRRPRRYRQAHNLAELLRDLTAA